MKKHMCVLCGINEREVDTLCLGCFLKKNPIIKKIPEKIKISFCVTCGKLFYTENSLENRDLRSITEEIIKRKTEYDKKKFDLKNVEADIDTGKDYTDMQDTEIKIEGEVNDNKVVIRRSVKVRVKDSRCDNCSKLLSNYYEGDFQLRYREDKISKKTIKSAVKEIQNFVEKSRASIVKEERFKNGYDFYISSSETIKELGAEMHKQYGGETKLTSTLFSRDSQTSKDIYRITMLLRLPEFEPGDIIIINNKIVKIDSINKYNIHGTNLKDWSTTTESYKKHDFKIIKKDEIMQTTVSKSNPVTEVIDPEDFQSRPVSNQPGKAPKKASIIKISNKIYLVNS